jgi:hypothetical protein
VTNPHELLAIVRNLQRSIRDAVVAAAGAQSSTDLSRVADDGPGDTIYAIDRVSEAMLVERLSGVAARVGGIVLVAEGVANGELVLPLGHVGTPAWRFIVDPIDGTRGLMYQKRSAWVLTAVAPNRGPETRLRDVIVAAQTEIPTLKQYLCDELWAVRGQGPRAHRVNRLNGAADPLELAPSRAPTLAHGYGMLSRFFPGARDELAALDEEVIRSVLGATPPGKALCFEDQYASTGGQLYELIVGHDRFNADLRPLMRPLLERRGEVLGLCCHPYDICTALIAEEAGVVLTDPWGAPLDAPLELAADVAWVGYANRGLQTQIEPALQKALARRGLAPSLFERARVVPGANA